MFPTWYRTCKPVRCESVACIYSHNPFSCLPISLCVCSVAACFLFCCLFLPLPPSCHRSPPPTHPPALHSLLTHLLTDSFSDAHTRAHTHKRAQRHMLCLARSEILISVPMPLEQLLYLALIRPQLQFKVIFAGLQTVLEFQPTLCSV